MRSMEWVQLTGKTFRGSIHLCQWWRSHQSIACKGFRILRFCFMSWKGESETSIKYCLGRTVELVQRFITEQNFGHNWRRTDGIRVEYFTGFTTLQFVDKVQEFMNKMGDPAQFQERIIFMSMFNDIMWGSADNQRECIAIATLVVSFLSKRFPSGCWSFLGLRSEKMGIRLTSINHEENATESLNWWWSNSEKADTQFSVPRVHCHEERSRTKVMDNYLYIFVPMEILLKLFFTQLFLLIGSVSTEQSQICVKNTVLAMWEQGDLFWQNNLTHCLCRQVRWW